MKHVLVVEDNEDDLFFIKMACKRSGIPHELHFVMDGRAAVDYLAGNGVYADRKSHPIPDVIFLDVKLPELNGHEVLEWIRSQPILRTLPVVMVTSSTHDADVNRAYELGVTSYLRKIASRAEFGQAVRVILKYWLELNITPS
jgi:CheY-like chemotaxis protein